MMARSMLLLLSAGNVAQALATDEFATFIFENDVVTDDSDDGYTSGLGYAWGYAGFNEFDDSNTPGWIQWLSEDLYISTMPDKRRAITYQIFQAITNPTDSDTSELQPDDYPYAGTLTWKVTQYAIDDKVTDTVSLLLGAVGPVSGAEPAQKLVHELTDSVDPQGWDNQLNNEPLFQLGAGRKWRLLDGNITGRTDYDVITAVEGTVGNLSSNADIGVTFRFGTELLKTYPVASLLPAREVNPMTGSAVGNYYVFLSLLGRYQANNIIIDGNSGTFDDDNNSDLDLEHGQNFVSAGFAVSFRSWSLLFSGVSASKEFDEDDDDRYSFGSLSVSWTVD
jgi:lipid A 3-O-deacylase